MATNGVFSSAAFERAAEQMRSTPFREELIVREIAAPEMLAPRALAFAADVFSPGQTQQDPQGSGRLVLLHDPSVPPEWGGPFRIVCFSQAPLEVEIGLDPLLAQVTWSWLTDALNCRGAQFTQASGTATKTLSTGFGALAAQGEGAQIELRASWTPTDNNFVAHTEAWAELLCQLAGFPQVEQGVPSLLSRRIQRG